MLLDCYHVNVKYYLICVKLLKMSLKFVTVNDNVFQLLGDFRPPNPLACAVLKISLKNPLGHTYTTQLTAGRLRYARRILRTYIRSAFRQTGMPTVKSFVELEYYQHYKHVLSEEFEFSEFHCVILLSVLFRSLSKLTHSRNNEMIGLHLLAVFCIR